MPRCSTSVTGETFALHGICRVVIQSFRVWNELEIELGLEFATVE